MMPTVNDFIQQCQQSSQVAYEQFKLLLTQLDDLNTRTEASDFLFELKKHFNKNQPKDCHFQFLEQKILDQNDETVALNLLQFPSTFLPEAWSFTFYEGLVRYPTNQYKDKKIVELGCGIGWISIALAYRYPLEKIIGLDINPKAITCARLNLYLNSLTDDSSTLLKRVSFFESDLLSHFDNQNISLDKVIGCIPQVLSPEPDVMETLIEETASDEYLQSLSNYSAKQGFIEDQFGLGLIASAVEQAIPLLAANGKLILNLGGRPGRSVIERLMQRRGFKVRRVWQTQVEQAADTEIDELVNIEKTTGHRFEFYMSQNAATPVNARTALAFAQSGGKIYHSVDVYEARMIFPEKVKSIFESIEQIGIQNNFSPSSPDKNRQSSKELSSAIDLTYEHYYDAEERYSFLAFFAKLLSRLEHFSYESTAGLDYFRQQLTEYFGYYLSVDINQDSIFITPGRRELITNLLTNYQPKLTLVAKSLSHLVSSDFDNKMTEILETPSQVEYLINLINNLKPQVVITQLDSHEIRSSNIIEQLVESSQINNTLLIIDLTNDFDLSSSPEIHGVYRYLSETKLPENLVLMTALTNNRVYEKYMLNITLTSNPTIIHHLNDSAELTYSRTSVLKQYYYGHLLEELLYFQRSRTSEKTDRNLSQNQLPSSLSLCKDAETAFNHPAMKGNHLKFDKDTIRMDYGENELPAPSLLKEALFESYLSRNSGFDTDSIKESLNLFLTNRFDIPKGIYSKVLLGNGVAPIYSALLNLCAKNKKSLNMPAGSYGYFNSAAEYKGLDLNILKTNEDNLFKLSAKDLRQDLSNKSGSWLFLNAPVVNPTGAIYSQQELNEILNIALENNVSVIIDSIFSGLEFDRSSRFSLNESILKFSKSNDCQLVVIGGISKEYSAGGLRFGYSWSTSRTLMQSLENEIIRTPHFTLNYSVQKIINAQLSKDSYLHRHLDNQVKTLANRAQLLTNILKSKGWKVLPPSGGLFLVAKPEVFINKNGYSATEGGDLATKKLFETANIVINNSTWTGLPGYCRFVLSFDGNDFTNALARLKRFDLF